MVRFGVLKDVESVNIIRKEVNDLHVHGKPDVFKPGFSEDMKEYLKNYANARDKFFLVCEVNGVVCAYAMVNYVVKPETPYRFELKFLEIQEIGTLKAMQGNGYGKKLVEKIKEIATQYGINRIELNMWTFNDDALKFYDSVGFKTYRRYLEWFND